MVSRLDTNWLMSLVRQESLKVFHGVEPLSVVEFLRVRFMSASGSAILAKFPVLKMVSMLIATIMYKLRVCYCHLVFNTKFAS